LTLKSQYITIFTRKSFKTLCFGRVFSWHDSYWRC